MVLSYHHETIAIVTDQEGLQSIPFSQISQIKFDAPKRCAIVQLPDKRNIIARNYRIDSKYIYYSGGKDTKIGIALSQISAVTFFPVAAATKKLPVPYIKQLPDYCGEASVAMASAYFGKKLDQKKINQVCGVKVNRGAYSRELESGIKKLGFKTKSPYWYPNKTELDFYADRNRLLQAIADNHPILLGFWANYTDKTNENSWAFDHFVLLVGYDLTKDSFIIHDPARKKFWTLSFSEFRKHRETKFHTFFEVEFIRLKRI